MRLHRDPVTGQPVASSPEAIVKAIVGLIPGGAALYNELAQTKVVSEAFRWFSGEFKKLNITLPYVIGLLKQAYDEMGVLKGKENIEILKRIFGGPLSRIKGFVYKSASKLKELALKGALHLIGGAAERVYGIINKGKATLGLILADPIGFARNLMAAVGQGFKNFVGNFVGHLKNTLKSWLFGNLARAGITLPETIDAKGIFHLASQILGLTYQNIRSLIVDKVGDGGEEAMGVAEKTVDIVQKVSAEGPQALWEEAKDKLADMRDTVISGIIGWVRNTIIVQEVTRLLGMFTPVGAIIEAGRGIYNTIMFFVQKANEIASLANAVFESITNIAQRRLGPAASYIESTLGKGLTLSIGFLAKYIGLGGIPEKIKGIIATVKKPVDTAIGKVTDWIASKVKLIVAKIKGGWEKLKNRFRKKKDGEADQEAIGNDIRVDFHIGRVHHTLLVQGNDPDPDVLMASENYISIHTRLENFQRVLDTDEEYREAYADNIEEIRNKILRIMAIYNRIRDGFLKIAPKENSEAQQNRLSTLKQRMRVLARNLEELGQVSGLTDLPDRALSASERKALLEKKRLENANQTFVDEKQIFKDAPYNKYRYADPRQCGLNRFLQFAIAERIPDGSFAAMRTRPHGVIDGRVPPKPFNAAPDPIKTKHGGRIINLKDKKNGELLRDEKGDLITQIVVSDLDLAFYADGDKNNYNNQTAEALGDAIDRRYRSSGIRIKNSDLHWIVFGGHGDNHNGVMARTIPGAIKVTRDDEVIYIFNSGGFVEAGRYQKMTAKYIPAGYTEMMNILGDKEQS